MENQINAQNTPRKYAKIPLTTRKKLIELVFEKSFSIAKASAKLSIKASTAKLIVKRYRQEGTFFEKRSDRDAARLVQEKLLPESSLERDSPKILQKAQIRPESQQPMTVFQSLGSEGQWTSMFWNVYEPFRVISIAHQGWEQFQNFTQLTFPFYHNFL